MTEPVSRTNWGAVAVAALGVVLAALDMTIVAVALPSIGAEFGVSPSAVQWVLLAYSLPLVALSVPAGRWLDRAGPLPAFVLATAGFGVTSLVIAVAPAFGVLLAGRVLQGVFGSLVGVVSLPIVARAARPEHRARAMGLVLTLIPLSGVGGPVVGGWLAESFGWRSVFAVNLPIVVLTLALARRVIPSGKAGPLPLGRGLPWPDGGLLREAAVLGLASAGLFGALHFAGVDALWFIGLLAVAGTLTAAWARTAGARPVLTLLRRREIALALGAMAGVTTGVGALHFVVPYLFADLLRTASPSTIGLALLSVSAAMAVTSPIAGVLADRIGKVPVASAGAVVALAGLLGLLLVGPGAQLVDVAWPLAVVGIGNGLFAGPNSAAVLEDTPPELLGTSSGVATLVRTLGFSLGPALGALTWTTTFDGFHTGILALAAAGAVSVVLTVTGRRSTLAS
ncbi:MFS transporter [Amycolatopsis sp. 195334CR]|uniref:MFS transporter n=1 Tax=Amycolatopsis sp. 195334CR TaxID=2814588 RepID=UPI001A8F6CE2|nr:MFS transporter [Amycolatopsis sp. 195334CR]MBN6037894.1 MFS transporter [Amycolatopsis sp. 195334CR]